VNGADFIVGEHRGEVRGARAVVSREDPVAREERPPEPDAKPHLLEDRGAGHPNACHYAEPLKVL